MCLEQRLRLSRFTVCQEAAADAYVAVSCGSICHDAAHTLAGAATGKVGAECKLTTLPENCILSRAHLVLLVVGGHTVVVCGGGARRAVGLAPPLCFRAAGAACQFVLW